MHNCTECFTFSLAFTHVNIGILNSAFVMEAAEQQLTD